MKKYVLTFSLLLSVTFVNAQIANNAATDTASFSWKGKVTVGGYLDTYYAYNFNSPSGNDQPYFVSMARHNEMNINLAYVDLKYTASRLRARFVPGFGTYVNSNNAAEPGSLRNIVEASAGIKLSEKKNIWIDAGVFASPYTNESAISKDHLAYTRSFAPEYVPYYLSGLKLTVPISRHINAYVYLLNGWQQIQDQNKSKSLGTQLEIRASEHLLLNWNTYVGNERSAADSTIGTRMFSDFYFIYSKERLSATGCVYAGWQEQAEGKDGVWWQANLIGRYNVTNEFSITGRIEHLNDRDEVQIVPITGVSGFRSSSSSLGLNYKLAENILLRLEGRTFFSDKYVYMCSDEPSKNSNTITSNITVWF